MQIVRVVGRGRVSVISGLVHMRCIILGAAATYANLTSQVLNAGGVCVSEGEGRGGKENGNLHNAILLPLIPLQPPIPFKVLPF